MKTKTKGFVSTSETRDRWVVFRRVDDTHTTPTPHHAVSLNAWTRRKEKRGTGIGKRETGNDAKQNEATPRKRKGHTRDAAKRQNGNREKGRGKRGTTEMEEAKRK